MRELIVDKQTAITSLSDLLGKGKAVKTDIEIQKFLKDCKEEFKVLFDKTDNPWNDFSFIGFPNNSYSKESNEVRLGTIETLLDLIKKDKIQRKKPEDEIFKKKLSFFRIIFTLFLFSNAIYVLLYEVYPYIDKLLPENFQTYAASLNLLGGGFVFASFWKRLWSFLKDLWKVCFI